MDPPPAETGRKSGTGPWSETVLVQPAKTRRTYVDASVFGGVFDEEFAEDSHAFFDQVEEARFVILTSGLVADEIALGPAEVRGLFERLLPKAELVVVDEEALALQTAYLDAGILTRKWEDDALHVALATVAGADLIVSWNCRRCRPDCELELPPHRPFRQGSAL